MSKNTHKSLAQAITDASKPLPEGALGRDDYNEFREYARDTLELLVNEPDSLTIHAPTYSVDDDGQTVMTIECTGPRAEIAMCIGRQGKTVKALHWMLFAVARRMGFRGHLRVNCHAADGDSVS